MVRSRILYHCLDNGLLVRYCGYMLQEQANSRKQGEVGLGAAIAYFTRQGITVCIPISESQRYDLVIEEGVELKKVQVKTTYYKKPSGLYEAALKTSGGNQSSSHIKKLDKEAIDYLFVLTEDGQQYLIPSAEIKGTSAIILGEKYKQFLVNL